MSTTTVTVTGMTCGHCASSVREEIGQIPGVTGVTVDLASGVAPARDLIGGGKRGLGEGRVVPLHL